MRSGFSEHRTGWHRILALVAVCAPGWITVRAQPIGDGRRPDVFGGYSSSQIVVQLTPGALRAPAFQEHLRRQGRNADPLAVCGARVRVAAAAWHSVRMRPVYDGEFSDPVLASKYGLDRTYIIEVPAGTDTPAMAAVFAALTDDIESATVDTIGGVSDVLIPIDTSFGVQYALHNTGQTVAGQTGVEDADIDAPEAWALHTGNPGTVTLAIIDSGVNPHPEYSERMVPGRNTADISQPNLTTDNCPHGTHVAGIAAAGGNNLLRCSSGSVNVGQPCTSTANCQPACVGGSQSGQVCTTHGDCPGGSCGVPVCQSVGVAGVTWGANIMPVRVLYTQSPCAGPVSALVAGIEWAADHGADVANFSLQYYTVTDAERVNLQNTINYARGVGMLLIAATGNSQAPGVVAYPARLPNCMGVGATTNRDQVATNLTAGWSSNTGNEIDLVAPGDDIYSTWINSGYTYLYGTSMATPHVSGLAALMKSYVPDLIPADMEAILTGTTDDLLDAGWDDRSGFGRINAFNALLLADVWLGILSSEPPDATIDARKPTDPDGTNRYGFQMFELTYGRVPAPPALSDFEVGQTGGTGGPPSVGEVAQVDDTTVLLTLSEPIRPRAWTTMTHVATGTSTRIGFLPGDVNGDGMDSMADVTELATYLAGGAATKPIWSVDISRDGVVSGADVLETVDLLNGAGAYETFLGAALP